MPASIIPVWLKSVFMMQFMLLLCEGASAHSVLLIQCRESDYLINGVEVSPGKMKAYLGSYYSEFGSFQAVEITVQANALSSRLILLLRIMSEQSNKTEKIVVRLSEEDSRLTLFLNPTSLPD